MPAASVHRHAFRLGCAASVEGIMENGSYAGGILGAVGGILLALLAIFIGSSISHALGGHHEAAAHSSEH